MVRQLILAWLILSVAYAAEVTLDLPEPLIPGALMTGSLEVRDAPSQIQRVTLPEVDGLEWKMSNQNTSETTFVNRHRSTVIKVGLTLRAAQAGTLQLPPVTVHLADASTLSSVARKIRVDKGDATLTGEMVASCAFDPPSIVPGQPTNLIYRLSLRVGEVSKLGVGPPEGAIALGEHTTVQSKTFDAQGREWLILTTTWPMTHATPGSYQVGGQQEYQIVQRNGIFNTQVTGRLVAVPPATLTVENLPAAGRPDGFDGLIGPLAASASLDRVRVASGEGAVLSIILSGRQSGLAKRPLLTVAGAQCYPKDESSGEGNRTFRWDVVPAAPGQTTIRVVSFPYFDPASRAYCSANTSELVLSVIPGRSRDLGIVGQARPTEAATAPVVANAPALPAPVRGQASARPPAWLAPVALMAGVSLGLVLALGRKLAPRRGPHRGRALRAAGRDPAALGIALAALRPALADPATRTAAEALQGAIDRARFGNEELPDLDAWLRILEVIA